MDSIRRRRELLLGARTRTHLDEVEQLVYFVEMQVVLDPSEDEQVGREESFELLGIPEHGPTTPLLAPVLT